ncbi:MAG: hypothetical protein QM784_31385 [Polyangiaceae bacterium]
MTRSTPSPEPPRGDQQDSTSGSWRSDFEQSLIESASMEQPATDLASRALERIAYRGRLNALASHPRSPVRAIVYWGAAVGLAASLILAFVQTRRATPAIALGKEPLGATAPAGSSARIPAFDPCTIGTRARGREPLIDDFEDGDDTIVARDGREGFWRWARDTDAPGTAPALLPNPRPEAKEGNRSALHVKGEQLKDWGASVELTFQPRCYDASAYDGIAFSARGPGRIYVALRQVDVIPPEFQGTCDHDCYNAHVRKIDLSERFQEYEVRWSEVEQRGYGKPRLDATRLHDIAFQVRSEDTPYDVWIDTVRFLQR